MNPGDHQKITKRAIDLYHLHCPGPFSRHLNRYAEEVIEGSKEADTTPLTVRATNWHFYPANDRLAPIKTKLLGFMPITIYPTSDHILKRRIEELKKEISKGISEDVFNLVGRILHHIQDMSTPAHAVPVYHGLDVLDLVEDELNVRDSFEEYSEENIDTVLDTIIVDHAHFEATTEAPLSPDALYEHAAQRTLKTLYGPHQGFHAKVDGVSTHIGWDSYWRPWSSDRTDEASLYGFGSYGPLGHAFGKNHVLVGQVHYEVPPQACSQLYRKQLSCMVLDSLRALAFVQQTTGL